MSAGIQHLLKGGRESNRVGESRVDKIETDSFNSIVERITHGRLNPSKLAAEVTKAKVMEESPDPASIPQAAKLPGNIATWGSGPAHQLAAQRPDAHVNFLAEKIAMLEHKLAQYETFNGQDNDVVQTTMTPAKKLNRGADSSAMGSNIIRKSNKNTQDPVDGKIDKKKIPPTQKQPEAQMAGVHVNILGMSMTEWREMTGLKAPPIDLTARPVVHESYEDEIDEASRDTVAVLKDIGAKSPGPKPPPVPSETKQQLARIKAMHQNLPRRGQAEEVEHQLWAEFLENYDMTPEEFSAFVEAADEAGDEEALVAVMELEDEFQEAVSAYMDVIEEDVGQLWSQWLEERGLSVETFDGLVEAIETEDDLVALEELQAMFEADIAGRRIAGGSPVPGGEAEIKEPGKAPVKTVSLARGDIKPSRKGNFSLPAAMRAKMGLPKEEGETFECDDDGSGHPNMNHKSWAKTLKRWSDSGKKGRK